MDDPTLVQRAVEGDKDAFGAIYDQYAPRLQAFLWWVLQDGERATEVLLDTFRIAGSRIHQLADPSRLRPWLYAIAAHEAVDAAGRTEPQPEEGDATAVTSGTSAAAADPVGEFVSVVRAGAEELSPRDRALLDLRYRQRLKNHDLGDAIGLKAEAADAAVQRVADRAEHLLGPTLAIRFSKKNCPDLQAIVGTNLGPLDARTRRKAEEHVDQCPRCDEWRRRITVSTLLGAAPVVPPPPDLRQRVLDDVQLAGYDGRGWSRRRGGFPPPLVSEHQEERLRRLVMAAAAAVIVGVVLVGALLLLKDDDGQQQVASVGRSTTTSAARATPTTVTVPRSTSSTTSTTGVPGSPTDSGGTGGTGTGGGGGGTGGGGTGGGLTTQGAGVPATTGTTAPANSEPEPEPTTTTTEAPPTTTTTVEPDRSGPSLSGLTISPQTVGCGGTARVSVQASDPSGIASVVAIPGLPGGGRVTMSGGTGTYSATVGPFSNATAGQDITSRVIIQATDNAGNESTLSGPITLSCASG